MTGTHILSKQNFLLLWPSWISQSAINNTNLCWQFQILQTVPNILVYYICKKKRSDSLKVWLHRAPLKMTLWEHKMTRILYILEYFLEGKFLFFLRNHLHSLENLQNFDYIIAGFQWDSYIWKKKNLFGDHLGGHLRFLSSPSVIITYANLCWQFQTLQTVPNILVIMTLLAKKKRCDSLKVWLHQVPFKMTLWEHKMTINLHILGYFPWNFLFFP